MRKNHPEKSGRRVGERAGEQNSHGQGLSFVPFSYCLEMETSIPKSLSLGIVLGGGATETRAELLVLSFQGSLVSHVFSWSRICSLFLDFI